jgi:hypothetical protein
VVGRHAPTKPTKIVEIVTVLETVFSEQPGSPRLRSSGIITAVDRARIDAGVVVLKTDRLVLRRWQVSDAALQRTLWTERDPRTPPHRRITPDSRPTNRSSGTGHHPRRLPVLHEKLHRLGRHCVISPLSHKCRSDCLVIIKSATRDDDGSDCGIFRGNTTDIPRKPDVQGRETKACSSGQHGRRRAP